MYSRISLALTKYPIKEMVRESGEEVIEKTENEIRKFMMFLRTHDAFSSTTMGALMNRWGVLYPPKIQVLPRVWLINLCKHLEFLNCKSDNGFIRGMESYLASTTLINFSFTEMIFRNLPRKKIIWITRDENINEVKFEYFLEDKIILILIPKIEINFRLNGALENNKEIHSLSESIEFITFYLNKMKNLFRSNRDEIKNKPFKDFEEIKLKYGLERAQLEEYLGFSPNENELENISNLLYLHNLIPDWTEIIYIPSAGNIKDNEKQEGSGGLILFEKLNGNEEERLDIKNPLFISLLNRVIFIHSAIQQFYSGFMRQDNARVSYYYAVRAGQSAIMSRNMSHNIGSHVLSELVAKGRIEEDNFELHRNFFRYLQHRMDFIAQITTEIPQWSYPAWFHKEIMREFYNQYVLLDRIGISEGLRAYDWPKDFKNAEMRGKIIIRVATQKAGGDRVRWIYDEYKGVDREEHYGRIDEDDFQIAVPGGNVGYHALYTIIEGFLRNEAKHNYIRRPKYEGDLIYYSEGECKIIRNSIEELNFDCCKEILSKLNLECFDAIIAEKSLLYDENGKLKEEFNVDEIKKIYERLFILLKDGQKPQKPKDNEIGPHYLTPYESGKIKKFIELEDYEGLRNYLSSIPLRINIKIEEAGKNIIAFPKQNQTSGKINLQDLIFIRINEKGEAEEIKIEEDKLYRISRNIMLLIPNHLKLNNNVKDIFEKESIIEISEKMLQGLLENYDGLLNLLEKDETIGEKVKNAIGKKDFYWITIWSDMPHSWDKKDEKVKIRLSDGREIESIIPAHLNNEIEKSFIDETGRLKKEHWGLQEMKISAGFLQMRRIEEIGAQGDYTYKNKRRITMIEEEDVGDEGYPYGIIKFVSVDREGYDIGEEDRDEKGIFNGARKRKGVNIPFYYTGIKFWVKRYKEVMYVNGGDLETKGGE